jgi:hypothetical protein
MRTAWPAVAVVLALLAGGCGGSGSGPAASTAGGSPTGGQTTSPVGTDAVDARTRVGDAVRRLVSTSFRATVALRQAFEVEGAPAALERQLEGTALATHSTVEAESARRVAGTTQVPLGTSAVELRLVQHDGRIFVSRDGRDWRRLVGEVASILEPALEVDPTDLADALTGVRLVGRTTVDGAEAERFTRAVEPSYVQRTAGAVFERVGLNADALDFDVAEGAFVLGAMDGRLLVQEVTTRASLDLSRLPGGPDGTVTVRADTVVRYTDHGAPITVEPPTVSGTLATPQELGSFLLGAP